MKLPVSGAALLAASLWLAPALPAALWIKGCDVSSLDKSEALGGTYADAAGTPGDALAILKASGVNTVRLRVFHTPADGYNNKTQVVAMAARAKTLGLRVLVDFHYSDIWADPGQQTKPAAWNGHSLAQLKTDVYAHTFDVCSALVAAGAEPDYVQVGNEINDGLLWDEGSLHAAGWTFDNLAQLLAQGIAAVRAAAPRAGVVLHIAKGGDWGTVQWWFDGVKAQGVDWDYTGLSYYPYWHGALAALQTTLNNAAVRYARPVLVCETAYPFTLGWSDNQSNVIGTEAQLTAGYPATVAGQRAMLQAILGIVDAVPNERGAGVVYWDATWIPVAGNGWDNTDPTSGNTWENQALFDFGGCALDSQTAFAGFPGYQSVHFTGRELADTAVSGDHADPDGDGLANLLEYGLVLDPRGGSSVPATSGGIAEEGGRSYLTVTFRRPRPATGLVYTVFTAESPAGPWAADAVPLGEPVAEAPDVESVVFRDSQPITAAGSPRRFLRVRVGRAP